MRNGTNEGLVESISNMIEETITARLAKRDRQDLKVAEGETCRMSAGTNCPNSFGDYSLIHQ